MKKKIISKNFKSPRRRIRRLKQRPKNKKMVIKCIDNNRHRKRSICELTRNIHCEITTKIHKSVKIQFVALKFLERKAKLRNKWKVI